MDVLLSALAGQVDGISLLLPVTLSPCHLVTWSPAWWGTIGGRLAWVGVPTPATDWWETA
jgi:hypothetical protein